MALRGKYMVRVLVVLLFASVSSVFGQALAKEDTYRVYDGKGNPSSIAEIVRALGGIDVVFLGEQHDDAVGHQLEREIFERAVTEYAAKRKVALSLEMFERDVQIVLDEYLAGQISEPHFLLSSRPWTNYKTDYRPLVELAKTKKLDVVAANAPRRYVNMVSRNGRDALNGLSKQAKTWLAPLPYGEPSDTYGKKFKDLMKDAPEGQADINKILASQSLWDATMSHSVAQYLKKNKHSLVIHLNGGFHTESRLGTVEHLMKYRPGTKALVVTMRNADDVKKFDSSRDTGTGDFVILTAPKPKSQGGVISQIVKRMDEHNKSLKSLKADLTMINFNGQLKISDSQVGNMAYLARDSNHPFYLRVNWTKPVEEQISLIGENYELYRPRLNQVITGSTKKATVLSFMRMTPDQFRANYGVAYLGDEKIGDAVDTWHLVITPNSTSEYKNVEAWIDRDGMPRQFKLNESKDDSTTLLLSNIQKNIVIKGETFKLNYPRSVKKITS